MSVRKGSRRHALTGTVFCVSMLCLGATGAWIGFSKHQTLNAAMGMLTFYLVATAWRTARHAARSDLYDLAAMLIPLAIGALLALSGLEAAASPRGMKEGYPAAGYFAFGSLALLFAAGDLHMLFRKALAPVQRLRRHLIRMSVGLFIAAASLFIGRARIFPAALRETNLLVLLSVVPLLLGLYWFFRIARRTSL